MALAFLRRHRAWFNWFLVAIILSFILLYIPHKWNEDDGSGAAVLAEVGGEPITVSEYQRAYMAQRARIQNAYQGRLDEDMLRRFGIREQALQMLIDERVLTLEAKRLGLEVDDKAVLQRVQTLPDFSRDGRFIGGQELRRRLELMGMTEREFVERMRAAIIQEKLMALVTSPVTVTAREAEDEFRRGSEQVKAEYVLADAKVAEESATDDEVKAYFSSHGDAYKLPERRVASYVLLDGMALQSRVSVTDREVEAYYEAHSEEFEQPEESCARHILVKVKAGTEGDGHPEAEALALAQKTLDQLKGGADFATVAKKVSEDPGSASQGGDLGCFGRGQMVPEFDKAAFTLEPGRLSDLVKTNFGYHIIRVESRKDRKTQPLDQARDRIRQTLLSQKARNLVEEKSAAISAALAKKSNLADVAREQGLTVQKSAPLRRPEGAPPLTAPALLARLFEMKPGQVEPEAFPAGSGYAFVALDEVQAPRLPELKEVQDRVKADLLLDKAQEKARARAAELKSRAEGEGLDKAAIALGLVRKETSGLVTREQPFGDLGVVPGIEEAAFALPPNTLSDPVRLPRGYAVLRVLEKKAFDAAAFAKEKDSLTARLVDQRREQLFRAYLQEARKRFPVEKRPEVLRRAVAS
jgi:peptidyl-prolyl cis-trans isomerase D